MISFWEKQSMLHTDLAIIGGGIVGLSVAASIKERYPTRRVTVFERSVLPYGASTRNAGFACFGSLTEILSDIRLMGESMAQSLVYQRWRGLQITRQRLGDARIGFEAAGGFELIGAQDAAAVEQHEFVNGMVADFIPGYVYDANDRISTLGLAVEKGSCLMGMKGEGQVHTGELMKALEEYVLQQGVVIRSGARVLSVNRAGGDFAIEVSDGVRSAIPFQAAAVVITTNAFARTLLPQLDVVPGRGQVFITRPIPGLKFRGNLHMDEGYYYLRNVDDRLLFGGARNLDFETEKSTAFELNEKIQAHLEAVLHKIIPGVPVETEQRWVGIMAFGKDKLPIVQEVEPGLFCACKMSGMGIALAGCIGEEVAKLV